MVNTTGGKNHKKYKKGGNHPPKQDAQIVLADKFQVYGCVKKKVGGSRILVECSDKKDRSGIIPGRFFKKLWFNPGDILLCSLDQEGDDSICHIEHKYSVKDANSLKYQGLISFDINEKEEQKGFKFIDAKKNEEANKELSGSMSDDLDMPANPNRGTKKSLLEYKTESESD